MKKIRILNIDIHNYRRKDFLENLEEGVVVTPNIDHLVKLQKDQKFYTSYINAEHTVCDSRIVQLFSHFLYPSKGIVQQIAGSDLFPSFCEFHKTNTDQMKVFLLGGTEESVKLARRNINNKYSSEIIIDTYSPPFGFEFDSVENDKILDKINNSEATVLAVGVGAPKQENWIYNNRYKLPKVKIFFAIGATISFESGLLKRAPNWITSIGFEWLYRMFQEPKRLIKRYLYEDILFLWLVFKQKLGLYKNPWNQS